MICQVTNLEQCLGDLQVALLTGGVEGGHLGALVGPAIRPSVEEELDHIEVTSLGSPAHADMKTCKEIQEYLKCFDTAEAIHVHYSQKETP